MACVFIFLPLLSAPARPVSTALTTLAMEEPELYRGASTRCSRSSRTRQRRGTRFARHGRAGRRAGQLSERFLSDALHRVSSSTRLSPRDRVRGWARECSDRDDGVQCEKRGAEVLR
eukprot:1505514-Rhodomonas_salina.2